MLYIKREIEKTIQPFLDRKEVIAIIGPRQAGKTTYLQNLKKNLTAKDKTLKFITFEKRSELALFQNNLEDFKDLNKHFQIIIIDEFQYVKDGGAKLKYLYDTTDTKFIISGSSSLELTFQTGKYMVGRIFNFTLLPFSFREFLSYVNVELFNLIKERIPDIFSSDFKLDNAFGDEINQRLENLFEEYLIWGGYPAVVLAKTQIEKQKILESVLENYLLRDIGSLLQLATEDELITLIRLLSTQIGNLVEYKELSNASKLSYKVLLKHINILRQTYIIDLIKPYFTNMRTELTKNPKAYFIDSGLRNFAITDFKPCDMRSDRGSLVENYVFSAIKRRLAPFDSLNFWRTKNKAEIDFVLRIGQKIIPIEVKYTNTPTIGKSVYSFINKFSPPELFLLTKNFVSEYRIKSCKIKFLPVYYL
ncbi:MAG: ATP-binding protein [Actinobacteria bacterium]|nr:ATP-binding protein [Actinomycetota bacterium]